MEESKELQTLYSIFRFGIYISITLEILVFVPFSFTGQIWFILGRIARWGIYDNLIYSKMATLVVVFVTTIGTRAQKDPEFNAVRHVFLPLVSGISLLCLSIYAYPRVSSFRLYDIPVNWILYMACSLFGVMAIHLALDNLSKIIKTNLMKDRFNFENESFDQQRKKIQNEYSVNIPMKYYYKGKYNSGWINIINPFRGTWVIGTPGSGKTFGIIDPFIRQHSAKGMTMVVYDYKFPSLAKTLFYQYLKNKKLGNTPSGCQFHVINFTNVEYSRRVNPIKKEYIPSMAAASETAEALVESLQKGNEKGGGGADKFFTTSAVNFLAACIYFFIRHQNGRYSSMAHILSFLNMEYVQIFDVLMTDEEILPLLAPFKTAYKNKAFDQLEGMIGTLRVQASRLATKEAFWVFSGDDFNLKVSDRLEPSYLVIANDPVTESINSSLNALILNRLVRLINTPKNIPVSIIIDELPTLYFHKIESLIATARSNKVAVTLGFQELPQLEGDYGKVGSHKITSVCANVICGSARNKETLEWLSNDIFGKVKQVKEGISITEMKTTINFNENMDALIPASKIADMPTGYLAGQTARDFFKTKGNLLGQVNIEESPEFQTTKFFCKTDFDLEEIKKEESSYVDLPIFYNFGSIEDKEKILLENFKRINREVEEMVDNIVR